jgi:hypothetical protein
VGLIRVTNEEYFAWFEACGFVPTGDGTELLMDMINERGTVIHVPRPELLSDDDKREATEGMSKFFGWKSQWGAH